MPTTIKHSLLRKIGQIYVEPNQLGIVLRDGRFSRFLSPGWHPALIPWEEQLVAHFPLEWRSAKVTPQIPARDGHLFTAVLDVQYFFDPNQAAQAKKAEMVGIALNRECDYQLKELVRRAARYSLRQEVNLYAADELRYGVYEQIERRIRQYLHRALTPLGVSVNKADSVFLEALTPTLELVQAAEADYRRRKIAQFLNDHAQVGQTALWLDTLMQQNGIVYHAQGSFEYSDFPLSQSVPIKPAHNGDGSYTTETHHLRNADC